MDGASRLRQLTAITLPLLSPAILFNLITGISGALSPGLLDEDRAARPGRRVTAVVTVDRTSAGR